MSKETFSVTNHLCRNCGGRVLRLLGSYASGGGNPVFRCADCGKGGSGMSEECICWCGFTYRGQTDKAYICLPFKGNEHLRNEFAKTGCRMDSGKAEVGIILRKDSQK